MARKKRQQQQSAAPTLDEFESTGDRIVEWIGENPFLILGSALGILFIAGIYAYVSSSASAALNDSSAALAKVQGEYRVAMGATPGSLSIPEPANQEAAQRIRRDHIAQYENVAEQYAGTTAGALALLEAGTLQQQLGEDEGAIRNLEEGLAAISSEDSVRPFLLLRLGAVHEEAGRWPEAAAAYESASEIASFPLRYGALADAARSYAHAGDSASALRAYARIEREAPNFQIPPYVKAQLEELRELERAG